MRGAFGKAHGTAARVKIGQILMSVRSYDKFKVCKLIEKYFATIKHQFWCCHAMAVFTLWEKDRFTAKARAFMFRALVFSASDI